MTDPISDILIRIKNALSSDHQAVIIPFSKIKMQITEILKKEGYISDCSLKEHNKRKFIKIMLRYINQKPAISGLKRISKPGRRIYVNKNYSLLRLGGIGIISTSLGIKTHKDAKKEGMGGEILCEIW